MAVGKILDTLREKGLLDNTLIIFTSDHGEMLQDKGYYSKELAYEGSVRVPLLLRYPKRLAGGRKIGGFVAVSYTHLSGNTAFWRELPEGSLWG